MRSLAALGLLGALTSRADADAPSGRALPATPHPVTAPAEPTAATSPATSPLAAAAATPAAAAPAAAAAMAPAAAVSASTAASPLDREGTAAEAISPHRRALAIAAAVGPGLLLHGAGSYVAKRPRTARRLLGTQALGVGMIVAGGLPILATYGSPKVTVPGVALAVTGFGTVAAGWLGDIWSAAGGDATGGVPRAEPPRLLDLGLSWLHDDYRGHRGYLEAGARWQRRQLVVAPHGRLATSGRSGEGGLDVAWRFVGARGSGELLERGHRLELRLGAFGRFDRDDRIDALWQEAELAARLDLRDLDVGLGGLFFEAGAGLGMEQTRYAPGTWDLSALLLARNAVGVYLGRGAGELSIGYDQRRDDLVGGLFAGRAAGFLGHVAAKLELRLGPALGLRVEGQLGTATMMTVALRYGGAR
jgi:hypothetical protein